MFHLLVIITVANLIKGPIALNSVPSLIKLLPAFVFMGFLLMCWQIAPHIREAALKARKLLRWVVQCLRLSFLNHIVGGLYSFFLCLYTLVDTWSRMPTFRILLVIITINALYKAIIALNNSPSTPKFLLAAVGMTFLHVGWQKTTLIVEVALRALKVTVRLI